MFLSSLYDGISQQTADAPCPDSALPAPSLLGRFGSDADGGFATQVDFVSNGSAPFKPYGNLGLGSGKMPGFGQVATAAAPDLGAMLTPDEIKEIVSYERYCLDSTTYTAVEPTCQTGTSSRTPPTTTTTVKKG